MFKQMLKEVPVWMKLLWIGGIILNFGLIGFMVWAIYKLVTHFTS
jgi:hypothetical protein